MCDFCLNPSVDQVYSRRHTQKSHRMEYKFDVFGRPLERVPTDTQKQDQTTQNINEAVAEIKKRTRLPNENKMKEQR